MKTQFDQIATLYAILNDSSLKIAISGGLYKLRRPVNSSQEDVVINSLSIGEGNLQRGIVNVNIHVPDLVVKLNGEVQNQPNIKRLGELSSLAHDILAEVSTSTYSIFIQSSTIIEERAINAHFQNIRLIFTFYNT